jgi:enoyl-CoA hydratase/carnithine racemase
MTSRVRISIEGGVADVRLNRPEKMNALDVAMFHAIADAGAELRGNEELRAVVLSGEGDAFCAGLDLEQMKALRSGRASRDPDDGGVAFASPAAIMERSHGIANLAQHVAWLWRELPVPVIAAVHGVVFGGGLQIALGADFRYAAPGTKFSIMETRWGLIPDMAGTQLMRHLAREDIVRELTYTARIFPAAEALEYGLVTRVCDNPVDAAMETARVTAGQDPRAIRAAKRLLNAASVVPPDQGLMMESKEQVRLLKGLIESG